MFNWSPVGSLLLKAQKGGRTLGVIVQLVDPKWNVMAVEAYTDGTLEDGLNDHGHKTVGNFKTLPEAMRAAEEYATIWIGNDKPIKKCDCGEIGCVMQSFERAHDYREFCEHGIDIERRCGDCELYKYYERKLLVL